ncbi:NAD dependent epimerase/dehydratase [Colletotrichum scovillei]|uniref:NAD dependent epimerase/dehydratase n=1 Tax=Colletotrichum scovillei TaxID=1209932 RepID=A0A9P7UD89_9PEZI|nr:NAD dependent epimerase/dehydratase [Colletotrichum scovillei]KAF4782571.1 NAD dependent epimerase/dehydratase [Colletotrichum scovillei]KAG7051408.1 NAD dependent epimerase/dehydratase [Colletotrichum scovillei]KAG7070446.1 NAD dependent epimerase/dehydratase [Colletotrichum scovillei]
MSQALPLQNKGIFRNLPTFPSDITYLTALITGANGISGFHTLRVLLDAPQRWKKVWIVSRSPLSEKMMNFFSAEQQARIEHISLDFLADADVIAQGLKERQVTADYVFFYSYLQPKPEPGAAAWSNAEALVKVNSALLQNFLGGLEKSAIRPKRIVLQTGAKNYGGHIGQAISPFVESAKRVTSEPNFYYPQEDALFDHCARTGAQWNVIRPSWIIGAVESAQMNAFYGLGVYAAVQAHLGRPLEFPGTMAAWLMDHAHSHAHLTGYLTEWAVLNEHCGNEAFNSSDQGSFSYALFWPELAKWFGISEVGRPELDESKMQTISMPGEPPIGFGPRTSLKFSWSFVAWAKEPENHEAWKEIMKKHNLLNDPFEDPEGQFMFTDVAVVPDAYGRLSPNKARMMGWNGFVDTAEGVFATYREFGKLGMLPPMAVDEARPLI